MPKTQTWLTETEELAPELDAPDIVIIDASWHMPGEGKERAPNISSEHIPGAIFFDIDEIADTKSQLPAYAAPAGEILLAHAEHGDRRRLAHRGLRFDRTLQRGAGVVDVPRHGRARM